MTPWKRAFGNRVNLVFPPSSPPTRRGTWAPLLVRLVSSGASDTHRYRVSVACMPATLSDIAASPISGRSSEPISGTSRAEAGWRGFARVGQLAMFLLFALAMTGCGTTQSRALTEQLLVSDAVDRAIQQIDFSDLSNHTVYLDDQFLQPIKGPAFVNAEYVESSLRQHLVASGCFLQDTKDTADIIVEARLGAMGADGHEVVYGIPQSNALSSAASLFANAPPVPAIPEISAGKMSIGFGAAKVAVFAYRREDRQPLWQSGVLLGKSHSRDLWMLGAGPIQSGTIYSSTRFAGQRLAWLPFRRQPPPKLSPVPYMAEAHFGRMPTERLAEAEGDPAEASAGDTTTAPRPSKVPATRPPWHLQRRTYWHDRSRAPPGAAPEAASRRGGADVIPTPAPPGANLPTGPPIPIR
ncbi:MAG: DUF6655 family protein [Pirellulaceae bacterium]